MKLEVVQKNKKKNIENVGKKNWFDFLSFFFKQDKSEKKNTKLPLRSFFLKGFCKGIWSKEGVWKSAKHLNPSTSLQGLSLQPLSPLTCRILQIPPSSATRDRNWSEFRNVHTKLGNRFAGDRVQKLVYSSRYLDVSRGNESDTD